jgi:hypothetical protein
MVSPMSKPRFFAAVLAVVVVCPEFVAAQSRPIVPGTGTWIRYVGDDFEESGWGFVHHHPKSSREQDNQVRSPRGTSTNGRWDEGPERGQPDQIEVVPTPAGGLEGSTRALLLRTLNSGIPGYRSMDVQQDDLIADLTGRLGTTIQVSETPSCTVRVYLPPFDQWEKRSGPHFGFRISTSTTVTEQKGFWGRSQTKSEPYWPGLWVHFRSSSSRGTDKDSAYLAYRGNRLGHDIRVKEIDEPGWWTLGMSVTPDGAVHYYASPGVDELTAEDHLTSQFPYSYRAEQFRTFFFNSCNLNSGRTWSTPIIIDDPKLYLVQASRIESIVQRREAAQERRTAQQENRRTQRRSR